MKKSFLLLIALFVFYIGFAQDGLLIQSGSKGLHLKHTVAPKETYYSLGRLYNVAAKDIAAFNALDMNKGLNVGQTVSIPLNKSNFSQTATQGVPVYYVVGEKEGLYRVSVNSGKVQLENLRKWNHLSSDNISTGQKLIVGYLQSSEMKSTAAAPVHTEAPAATQPAAKEPQPQQPVTVQAQKQQEEPKTTPVKETKPAATPVASKPVAATGGSGYFKGQFEQQSRSGAAGKDATVTSGIFKTASGWQDAKYYALMDKVEPGTIVQVVNPTNNKAIYAKVLGEMSGIRQNAGLELRISNAAASALDITDTEKFVVKVVY